VSPKWSSPRPAPVSDSPVPQPSAPGHRPRAVLVVGDDRASREGLRAALEGDGHAVETAADVWHALARTRDRDFDVVVVDLDLPPAQGVRLGARDIVQMLHAYRPGAAMVVVSAEVDTLLQRDADALRIAELLEKPINPHELRAIVRGLQT
jgi:DNA-binding NtrC family response regulator